METLNKLPVDKTEISPHPSFLQEQENLSKQIFGIQNIHNCANHISIN
jgi:hypothetical protein